MNNMNFLGVSNDELLDMIRQAVRAELVEISTTDKKNYEEYLTRKQAKQALGISLPTLRRLTVDGLLPSYKLRGRVLYKRTEIDNMIANGKIDFS